MLIEYQMTSHVYKLQSKNFHYQKVHKAFIVQRWKKLEVFPQLAVVLVRQSVID